MIERIFMKNEDYPVLGFVYGEEEKRDLVIGNILNLLERYFSNSKIFTDVSIEVHKRERPIESPLVRYLLHGKPLHQDGAQPFEDDRKVLLGGCSLKKIVIQYLQTKQTYVLTFEIFSRTPDIFRIDKELSLQEAKKFYQYVSQP